MFAALEWFGTATWRLFVEDTVIWLDAYLNRAASAPPLPLRAEQIESAHYILIGHSHFDHIADAAVMARNSGGTVVGSALSCEIVRDGGIPAPQTTVCSGGEKLQLGPVAVRVFPSLHGFNGLREWPDPLGRDRAARVAALRAESPEMASAGLAHLENIPPKQMQDGGPLAYLLEWDGFRLFWHDTPGMVTPSWEAAATPAPDLALFSAAAAFSTPNVDGVPFEAGAQPFVAHMTRLLRPHAVTLNHHDDWCPPITFHLDEEGFREGVEAAGAALRVRRPGVSFTLSQ
ncbi:MAG: MBL fold metallo-hydrolase [Tepidiformaceae bacterium]